jgi:hypothetical protein
MSDEERDKDRRVDKEPGSTATGKWSKDSGYIRHPDQVEDIYKGYVVPLGDYMLEDLFSRYHPDMKKDRRISHAIVLWSDMGGLPLYLIKWWAPAELHPPDELARATFYESDLDHRVIHRGHKGGAIRSWEQFSLWEVEDEHDGRLLGLGPDELAIHAAREFYDDEGVCLAFQRQIITDHYAFGYARDFRYAKQEGISTEW